MNPIMKNRIIGCVTALAIFVVDQLTKNYVTKGLGIDRVGQPPAFRDVILAW